jgi:hypothetical protein
VKRINSVIVVAFSLIANSILPSANAEISDAAGATAINFFWQAPTYSEMTWITRDVVVTKSGEGTYFSIIGNWNPPFYLGVQEFKHPRAGGRNKIAIFSAWDTYEKNDCMTCGPETRPLEGRTVVKDLGPEVYSGGFGYEGTGAQAFMWDFDWKIGDRIRAAVNLRTVSDGTEISAALQLNDLKWRYFGTYKYSKKFSTLEPGYSFIEDFLKTPRTVRAAEYGNTWMESEDLSSRTPINFVQARANTDPNTKYHLIKQLNPMSLWGQVGGDEFISKQEYVPAKIEVSEDLLIPLEARVAALNLSGDVQRIYEQKYLKSKNDRIAKALADAKAIADKAATELKVKQEAEAKAAGELKAKQDAEAKAAIDKAAAEKAAADKAAADKTIQDAKLEAARILAAAKAAANKKTTITCVKGKLVKKVTAIKPKCPAGYKVKK